MTPALRKTLPCILGAAALAIAVSVIGVGMILTTFINVLMAFVATVYNSGSVIFGLLLFAGLTWVCLWCRQAFGEIPNKPGHPFADFEGDIVPPVDAEGEPLSEEAKKVHLDKYEAALAAREQTIAGLEPWQRFAHRQSDNITGVLVIGTIVFFLSLPVGAVFSEDDSERASEYKAAMQSQGPVSATNRYQDWTTQGHTEKTMRPRCLRFANDHPPVTTTNLTINGHPATRSACRWLGTNVLTWTPRTAATTQ